jgi:uncharacterized membrane protein YbaN (DUF454 family)
VRARVTMDKGMVSETASGRMNGNKVIRILWLVLGLVCVGLGTIGIVLPILPTTPFLLAAAACFCKSSTRLYNWLIGNKWFGEYIRNYKEGKGIPMKTKIIALTVLWATIGVSNIFILSQLLPSSLVLPMQLIMLAIATGVSVHILRLPTFKKITNN